MFNIEHKEEDDEPLVLLPTSSLSEPLSFPPRGPEALLSYTSRTAAWTRLVDSSASAASERKTPQRLDIAAPTRPVPRHPLSLPCRLPIQHRVRPESPFLSLTL